MKSKLSTIIGMCCNYFLNSGIYVLLLLETLVTNRQSIRKKLILDDIITLLLIPAIFVIVKLVGWQS
ncbi:MAG: hypothetical protein D6B25_08390 [Desulfobulbaceae bacterium]|nr:MAG: hypothetical protein D6B25_08390 [Desulfobulbaceae bacterium]